MGSGVTASLNSSSVCKGDLEVTVRHSSEISSVSDAGARASTKVTLGPVYSYCIVTIEDDYFILEGDCSGEVSGED